MFAKLETPSTLSPESLDNYLAQGWFRLGQNIFTTQFLHFSDKFYSAVWLRVALSDFTIDKTQQKLAKLNSAFKVEISVANITVEHEALFDVYKQSVTFNAAHSLQSLLFGNTQHNIYHTHSVNIYDGDKLIGSGFFDVGKESAAGITSFYDPAYKKHSLGRYLIYLKIAYCKNLGLQFFYPGYFVPGYPLFDYKLKIGTTLLQYFQLTQRAWLPIKNFSDDDHSLKLMRDKLETLHELLTNARFENEILYYEYFDANLIPDLKDAVLFDFPVFIHFNTAVENLYPIVVYDISDEQYHLITCRSLWSSENNDTGEVYTSHLLKVDQDIYSTGIPELMLLFILDKIQIPLV